MALTVEVGVAQLAVTRFAISPLSETVACLQRLSGRDRNAAHLRWLRWAEDELARVPLDLAAPGRYWWAPAPIGLSFSSLPPAARPPPSRMIWTHCGAPRHGRCAPASPVSSVTTSRPLRPRSPPTPQRACAAVANELRLAYYRLVAPHWGRIRAVLEADITYRARQLALGGAEKLFTDLHQDLRWRDGRLMLTGERWRTDSVVNRGPGGLVLMPVALGSPYVLIKKRTSTQTTVRYPARGAGALWTAGTQPPFASAVQLLGRVRASILEALRSPTTTTELARALGVTPSAVSQHLTVLRKSGLVARERSGRSMLYLTTELGMRLL